MKNKINKMLSLILLLSMLNDNILSMQEGNMKYGVQAIAIDQDIQQELSLLGLPAEIIEYILYQIIKPYENRVGNINNIFEFYSQLDLKPLVSDLSGISLTSKDFRLWTLDLIDRLKKLKEKKYQELVNTIKDQYQGLSKDELNSKLRDILNQLPINRNSLEEAAKLILIGANVNYKANAGYITLMFAALTGHKGIVQLLIDNGANVNEKSNTGYTALIWAAINGHKDIVQLLIGNGANVNEKNNNGYTALIFAARKGHKNIVQLLIDNDANVNQKTNYGATALILAEKYNHKAIISLLKAHSKVNYNYNCIVS